METWQQKQPEKMPYIDAALQAMEKKCEQHERRLFEKYDGHDVSHTRELLAYAYAEACARAKDTFEGKA